MLLEFEQNEIFFTSRGKGKPLVFLHGFLESSKIWNDFSTELSKHRQIVCIDFPGHGNSDCLAEIHSMELLAEVVYAVLYTLKIEKADFLGHSMGGYVCMAFLEKYPSLVNQLILLNSTPAPDSEERKINRERAISVVKENKKAYVNTVISNLLPPDKIQKTKEEINTLKAEALQFSTQGIIALLEGMKMRKDRTKVLREFRGEKIIVAGKQDPILEHKTLKKLAASCNCKFISLPGGHLSYIENKKAIIKWCISSSN